MSEDMQGIMSLPDQSAMEQSPAPTAEQSAAFEQMRSQLSPSEINTEMLGAAEQADPATVAEFKAELQGLELPPEVLDMLNTMVEEILDAPQDYEAIRAKYMAQGLEDLLPPEFDATFFGALNMAIDQIRGSASAVAPIAPSPMGLEEFAQGGIASLGRNGDTMLAHINPEEAALLRSRGGSGSINPRTGLPEFFSLKGAFKKIGRAVKKFASSTVGKIVIGAALFAVAGPAAAAMFGGAGTAAVAAAQGFAASAGTSLLAGNNLKSSLKAGAVGALTAGALKGVTQGRAAFRAPAAGTGPQVVTSQPSFDAADATRPMQTPSPSSPMGAPVAGGSPIEQALSGPRQGAPLPSYAIQRAAPVTAPQGTAPLQVSQAPAVSGQYNLGNLGPTQGRGFTVTANPAAQTPSVAPAISKTPGFFGNMKAALTKDTMGAGGADTGFFEGLNKAFNPNQIKEAGIPAARKAFDDTLAQTGSEALAMRAYDAAMPGMISQLAPLAATGLGIMALGGGFEEEEVKPPEGFEGFMAGVPVQDEANRIRYGGVNTVSTTPQYNPYSYTPPRAAAKGGSMDREFPRKTGPINGPGTGTSDDIPAMLSDGEFVFTAKAVRGMGNGSRRAGAKKMYALMRKLEGRNNA
jgi:hypothetical protein